MSWISLVVPCAKLRTFNTGERQVARGHSCIPRTPNWVDHGGVRHLPGGVGVEKLPQETFIA